MTNCATRSRVNRRRGTQRARRDNRTRNTTRNGRRRNSKCSRRRNKRNTDGRRRRRSRFLKGGALCPGSDDPYDIGGTEKANNIIAESTYYIYKDVNDENIAVKEVPVSRWCKKDKVENEFNSAKTAGDIGVGPKVFYTTFCEVNGETTGYMVMERIFGRTFNKSDRKNEELVNQVNELLKVLGENNMHIFDLHSLNVMIGRTKSDETDRVYFVDFSDITPLDGKPFQTIENMRLIDPDPE